MTPFKAIRARAAKRKGGEAALASLLPKVPSQKALARVTDDRVLAEMAQRIFSAGFVWSVIEKKWPGFEAAFLGFEPKRLNFQPDEFWEKLAADQRIVRNPQKIKAVRENAAFILDIAKEHGSFGKFIGAWPADDQVGLLEVLGKRGARLGGMTGQYFLRFIGKDIYIASNDMIACLRDAGLDISGATSKKDQRKIQDKLNAWAKETGLPYTHLSRICAMSIGENYDAETLRSRGGGEE
jgi:3-methyladenine DNA glycosylase Tag